MITEPREALKTVLESLELTPWEGLFVNVFNYHTMEADGYPYCTFEFSEFEGKTLDSCTNERALLFNVVVLQAINDTIDREAGLNIIYNCFEKIVEKLDGDMDLGEHIIIRGDASKGAVWMIVEWEWETLALQIDLTLNITTVWKQ